MNSRIFLILTIIVALLSILLSFFAFKFSLWFWIFLIIWFVFAYFIYSSTEKTNFDIKKYSIALAVLFGVTLSIIFLFKPNSSSSNEQSANAVSQRDNANPNSNNIYALSQSDVSTTIYSIDKNGDKTQETVEADITPFLNLNKSVDSNNKLVEFKIRNIKLKNNQIGNVKVIAPQHVSNDTTCFGWYLEDCKNPLDPNSVESAGDTVNYKIVDGEAKYIDEVSSDASLISPKFEVVISDLGTFDHDAIMSEEGKFDSGKVTEYAGVDKSKLGNEWEYEVYMKFDDGTENSYKVSNKLKWW